MTTRRTRVRPSELRRYALAVAKRHRVTLIDNLPPGRRSVAIVSTRVAFVQPIVGVTSYATALHEIGHCAMQTPRPRTSLGFLYDERRTWRWARQRARAWTPAVDRYVRECLDTYEASLK